MTFDNRTVASALWVTTMCAVGLAAGVASAAGWMILAAGVLLPAVFVLRVWSGPPQTISERIQEARR